MISLSVLKWLEESGIGKIGDGLYFDRFGLNHQGACLLESGGVRSRGQRSTQEFEIFCKHKNWIENLKLAQKIIDLLDGSFGICQLPEFEDQKGYKNITILRTSGITKLGLDGNGLDVLSVNFKIIF